MAIIGYSLMHMRRYHDIDPITLSCVRCGATMEAQNEFPNAACVPDGKAHPRVSPTQFDAPRDKPFTYTRQPIDDILDRALADIFNHGTVQPGTKDLLK